MGRVAIVSAVSESSVEARLLRQHGFTMRVAGSQAADVVLPMPGGSLAFVVTSGGGASLTPAAGRAAQAAKAARRCTILWVRSASSDGDEAALQQACPASVSILICDSHEQACEFMLSCAQRVTAASAPAAGRGSSAAEELDGAQHLAAERATALLAQLWGAADTHAVDFLLAAQPLSTLARVTSAAEWERLTAETRGLVDEELLYVAVDWLQRDAQQVW